MRKILLEFWMFRNVWSGYKYLDVCTFVSCRILRTCWLYCSPTLNTGIGTSQPSHILIGDLTCLSVQMIGSLSLKFSNFTSIWKPQPFIITFTGTRPFEMSNHVLLLEAISGLCL